MQWICIFCDTNNFRNLTAHTLYIHKHMWTRLQMSGFGYFSHTRCNLHRQTLAVEWPYWRAQWLSTWRRHRMPPFQQVSLSKKLISGLIELPRSTVSAVIVNWKHQGATTTQPRSGRPHKLTEWYCEVLKHIARKNLSSVASLTTEFQSLPPLN
jgi:hypothetical protein